MAVSTPQSNYNIVSNREKFDDKQKKIIDKVKLDLFESLDIDSKLVNRNHLSQKLEFLRVDNGMWYPFGKVELKPWLEVDINDKDYKDILDKYKDLLANTPDGFENELRKLDSQLAERLILDKSWAIEFKEWDQFYDWKDAKTEAEIAYDWLNNLKNYHNKIELASKKVDNIDYFIIKWNNKQLQEIKKAEEKINEELEKPEIENENNEIENPEENSNKIEPVVVEPVNNINEPETNESKIKDIDEKMNQILWLIDMSELSEQYNKLSKRRDSLKVHMQNFDKNWFINADTDIFRSIYPALEHEINEFKKDLDNAILDLKDKLSLIEWSGISDLPEVIEIQKNLEDILEKYNNIIWDFNSVHNNLLIRIYEKTLKQIIDGKKNENDIVDIEKPVVEERKITETKADEREDKPRLDDELDVNFSDMEQSIADIADERTYNQDSREYVEALKNKNTKFGKMLVAAKHAMFWDFFRMRKYKKEFKDMDGKKKWLNVQWDRANVAKVHWWQWLKAVMEMTQASHPLIYDEISRLAFDYYSSWSTMTDITFEKKLNKIFTDNRSLIDELNSKGVSIDKSASDILQSLQIQKAQNTLTYQVSQAVSVALGSNTVLSDPEADALSTKISVLFKNFTQHHKLVPQLFTHYNKLNPGNEINLNDSYENISKQLVAHLDSLTMISAQSMTNRVKLNIKFLANWHSTDHIEAKKLEKQSRWNPAAKLWNIMYGKWYKWRRFPTKVLATWWAAALGAVILWPLWWIVAWSIVAWSLAAGKKSAQTQRKKHSIEREYIKDIDNKTNIMNQEDLMKLKYLDDIWNYKEIKTELDRILSQAVISDVDKNNLVWLLSRIVAWLDHQKETGHNAFSLKKSVRTSRPEADEITREKNYNEAMSELYKLKELSLKRLQLQDENITEDDIRNEDQYDSYSAWYKWDFKKFLKLFKKERRKEMRKTWWRTAAIYGAAWWFTLWLSHFLDRVWWHGDVDVNDIDAGDATVDTGINPPTTSVDDLWTSDTLYNLWDFEASPDFSQDISDQIASMPAGTNTIKVDYFAGVDGTAASASKFSMDIVDDKVTSIQDILDSGNFSQETIDNVNKAISEENINEIIKFAESNWADVWNRNLFATRNLEGIEELLKQVDGKSDVNFEFNFDTSDSVIWHDAYIPEDRLSGLNLEAVVNKDPDIPGPINPGPSSTSWRWGQWVYTEDNTHKWQDNL